MRIDRLPYVLLAFLALAPAPPAAVDPPAHLARAAASIRLAPEVDAGGFVLYQPFHSADGQVADGTFTPEGEGQRTYSQQKVRWAAVGFLRVEAGSGGTLVERWYLSLGERNSTAQDTHVPWVEKYYWPGRSTPTGDKHHYWNNLSVRFERRNDLSGAVDLAAFVEEIGESYGYDLSSGTGHFTRRDATTQTASGY